MRGRSIFGRPPQAPSDKRGAIWVPAVTLTEILAPYPIVDLIDLDIQGGEYGVVAATIRRLNARVRRVHVGTHNHDTEEGLRKLFAEHGWTALHDYPCHSVVETPYGRIAFADGVQSWINPNVGRPELEPATPSYAEEIARLKERAWRLKKRLTELKHRSGRG